MIGVSKDNSAPSANSLEKYSITNLISFSCAAIKHSNESSPNRRCLFETLGGK